MNFLNRFLELGLHGCFKAINRRTQKHLFRLHLLIPKKHPNLKNCNIRFLDEIIKSEEFSKYLPQKFKDKSWIIQQANLSSANHFEILGSEKKYFKKIPWQNDFKAFARQNTHNSTWQNKTNIFYQNIKISCPCKMNLDEYNPDIKVPWELSRFQHIFALGRAYQMSIEIPDIQSEPSNNLKLPIHYASAFQNQINDWIDQNPYLMGVNWVCPMDIAIRAINWIWGVYFFKDAHYISTEFWNKLISSLHMHLHYLKFNWETSDKPNNHYISDLIGYLYLCVFFNSKKQPWCIKKIIEQFSHQIQPDGTAYEGSTSYHMLDTEIFWHFKLICQAKKIPLPVYFLNHFQKMITFMQACKISNTELIQIGDNDSGKIVTGIEVIYPNNENIKNFPNFGIVIINQSGWHLSLRYPEFNKSQPTGHFHQDALSITLSINGIPILVDPGTYVYTANQNWRNTMRSWEMHNTFNISDSDKIEYDLFQMPIKPQKNLIQINQSANLIQITAKDQKNEHLTAHRALEFDSNYKCLTLEDWWDVEKEIKSKWNLIFNPEIQLKMKSKFHWIIESNEIPLLEIYSTLEFTLNKGFYSNGYGCIKSCPKLTSKKSVFNENQKIIIKQFN